MYLIGSNVLRLIIKDIDVNDLDILVTRHEFNNYFNSDFLSVHRVRELYTCYKDKYGKIDIKVLNKNKTVKDYLNFTQPHICKVALDIESGSIIIHNEAIKDITSKSITLSSNDNHRLDKYINKLKDYKIIKISSNEDQ